MKKSAMIKEMRDGLDAMLGQDGVQDPEWAKINALRFMENYRVMRALEEALDDDA